MYGDRLNQVDLRLARFFRLNKSRLQAMVDVYNVFNASPVLAYNLTYGAGVAPSDRRPGRAARETRWTIDLLNGEMALLTMP
jgi:hypothetical protein